MRLKSVFFSLLLAIVISSCSILDKPEEVPAFFRFRNPRVVLDTATGFSTNTGIRDIWLYQGGFLQGTYAVNPVEDTNWNVIPFLNLETADFFMDAGIHESGQSVFHLPYPFWDRVYMLVNAEATDTIDVEPVFYYIGEEFYELPMSESFENGSVDLIPFASAISQPDSTFISAQTQEVFQGNYSGHVSFGSNDRWFDVVNSTPMRLDRTKNTYLEITYKSTVPFNVGLVYTNPDLRDYPIITVSPRSEWNTIYIHLIEQIRTIIGQYSLADIWVRISADGEGDTGDIYFDNIRVIREE